MATEDDLKEACGSDHVSAGLNIGIEAAFYNLWLRPDRMHTAFWRKKRFQSESSHCFVKRPYFFGLDEIDSYSTLIEGAPWSYYVKATIFFSAEKRQLKEIHWEPRCTQSEHYNVLKNWKSRIGSRCGMQMIPLTPVPLQGWMNGSIPAVILVPNGVTYLNQKKVCSLIRLAWKKKYRQNFEA